MTKEFINAAVAGILSRAAELVKSANDNDTRRVIASEAKRVADKVLDLCEPSNTVTQESSRP